jgi:hypothetical protein
MDDAQIAEYVDAACAANGLKLADDERARVIDQYASIAVIAAPLLELPLGDTVEIAPVFRP